LLCEVLVGFNVKPLTSRDVEGLDMRRLCSLVHSVRMSKLAFFRFVRGMSPLVPFLTGLSVGLEVYPVLLVESKPGIIPSNLAGWDRIQYLNFGQLERQLAEQLPPLIEQTRKPTLPVEYSKFDEKARDALGQILLFLSQNVAYQDKLEVATALCLYAIRSSAGSLMVLSSQGKLKIEAMIAPIVEMDAVGEWREFGIDEGICGWVARHRQPHRTGNVRDDPFYEKRTFDRNLTSLACVPIIYEDEVLGVLNADSREPDFFRDMDIEILQFVAKTLAPVIAKEKEFPSQGFDGSGAYSSDVRSQLLQEPVCLSCSNPSMVLGFRRIEDEDGLRYRMFSTCTVCRREDDIRTYILRST
jgi:hypothetical protein